jgi:hypothetical protein
MDSCRVRLSLRAARRRSNPHRSEPHCVRNRVGIAASLRSQQETAALAPSSWRGSYGELIVKCILHGVKSFFEMTVRCASRCVRHPDSGRSPWLRPIGLQARIRWNLVVPYHGAPFAGPVGTWGAGPILTAAFRSHSPARCTAHPEPAPEVNPGLAVRLQMSIIVGLFLDLCWCMVAPVTAQAAARRAPAGTSPVST